MTDKLIVTFAPPRDGWLQLELRSGVRALEACVSHTPFDSLEELASAVSGFLETGREGRARIHCEPDQYDLLFESGSRPRLLRVRALSFPRGRRTEAAEEVWQHEAEAIHVGRTLWRAFRKLETQFDTEHWLHPFPSKIVDGLDRLTSCAVERRGRRQAR